MTNKLFSYEQALQLTPLKTRLWFVMALCCNASKRELAQVPMNDTKEGDIPGVFIKRIYIYFTLA